MATLTADPTTDRRPEPARDVTTMIACDGCVLPVRGRDAERRALTGGLVLYLCPACVDAIRDKA